MTGEEFKRRFIPLSRKMFSVAARMSGCVQEAEDIVQDAFMKLWNRRDSLPPMDNAEAYCVALVKNIGYDRLRRKSLKLADSPPETARMAADTDITTELEAKDHAAIMSHCIAGLPEKQRLLVTLRDINGLEYDEISSATGFNETDIRVTLSRARRTLREQFKTIINHDKRNER